MKIGADEVVIVDDASPEDDYVFVKTNFPQVKVFKNNKNLGFGETINRGVRESTGEILILLNQDVTPHPDILKYLKSDFQDPQVFGVSLAESQYGPTTGEFSNGFISHRQLKNRPDHLSSTFWVSGGSGAVRKSYWNQLGGFDPLYSPGYWEDVDLSYRAHKRGWQVLWDPRAQVEHVHEQAFGGQHFNQSYKRLIQERNHLLFNWKNLQDRGLLAKHFEHLVARMLQHPGYLRVIFMAIQRLPMLLKSRSNLSKVTIPDRQILQLTV